MNLIIRRKKIKNVLTSIFILLLCSKLSLSKNADIVYPYTIGEFIKMAIEPKNRNVYFYNKRLKENPYTDKNYDFTVERNIKNIFFEGNEEIKNLSLNYDPKEKFRLDVVEMYFSDDTCYPTKNIIEVMKKFRLKHYDRLFLSPHSSFSIGSKKRIYVWHPNGIEVSMEESISRPNCVNRLLFVFSKENFVY